MASRKKTTGTSVSTQARLTRGRTRPGASFPVPPVRAGLPDGYVDALTQIKERIQSERLRVVLAANAAMVSLYWDIGRMILDRQGKAGWGAKVIDRLSADLREAFPDLKAIAFDPGFVGQLNLYLSAVDDLLRHPDDKPTIGLLLCRSKDQVVVEYALRDLAKPVGVAEWETRLVETLPEGLRGSLPTVEEIEAELGQRKRGSPRRRR